MLRRRILRNIWNESISDRHVYRALVLVERSQAQGIGGLGTLHFRSNRAMKRVGDYVLTRSTFAAIDSFLMAYVSGSATLMVRF